MLRRQTKSTFYTIFKNLEADIAPMAELVDAGDSKSPSERSVGSSPTRSTISKHYKVTGFKCFDMVMDGWQRG